MKQKRDCQSEPGRKENETCAPARLADMGANSRSEYWATLALRHCPGLGVRSQAKLLKKYGSAVIACRSFRHWSQLGLPTACAGDFSGGGWRPDAKKEWDCALKSSALILLWNSRLYPDNLRELPDAPVLLYCRGALDLLASPCLGMVGSRTPTAESLRVAASLAKSISDCGITVVSGMALGIDREVHAAALNSVGGSIGILGTGIDVEYPRSNRDIYERMRASGLLLSEFSPDMPPAGCNFPIRNRIISGLSLGVLVVEAAARSGSLITARLALEQNRDVFAVPGSALNEHSAGCQNLVRQGARPVFNADDVLRDLADRLKAYGIAPQPVQSASRNDKKSLALRQPACAPDPEPRIQTGEVDRAANSLLGGDDSEKILAALKGKGQIHLDAILVQTGLDSGRASAALLALEMLGRIKRVAGSRYEIL